MTDADKKRVEISDAEYIRQWKIDIPFVLEADRHNERVDRIAASHAEAVALLGQVREVLEGCTSLILELDPNEATMQLDDQIQALLGRLAKVRA